MTHIHLWYSKTHTTIRIWCYVTQYRQLLNKSRLRASGSHFTTPSVGWHWRCQPEIFLWSEKCFPLFRKKFVWSVRNVLYSPEGPVSWKNQNFRYFYVIPSIRNISITQYWKKKDALSYFYCWHRDAFFFTTKCRPHTEKLQCNHPPWSVFTPPAYLYHNHASTDWTACLCVLPRQD